MYENNSRRSKKFTFKTIEDTDSYGKLKKLPVIPSHKQLLESSIFSSVDPNFKQLKEDISSLYGVVERDVSNENKQIGLVELQLKKSLKKVNHVYNDVKIERTQNAHSNYNSKLLDNFINRRDRVQSSVNEIDTLVNGILDNIVKINHRFAKNSQMLNENSVNKQHYPLLFQLINEKFPKISSSPPPHLTPSHGPYDESRVNQNKSNFMLPTLRKSICAPSSTSTTLENINASEIISTKRLR